MNFLGCHQRKSRRQIEPHLVAKNADRTRTRAVGFTRPVVEDMLKKVVVLLQFVVDLFMSVRRSGWSVYLLAEPPAR